uniref:BRCT domain-containing protein n=1 Tax=Arion vulgaris TaxID=1028688 RepID=A0A0B6Y8G8_9EUPU
MFENKTAWFSASCHNNARQLWVENGGKLTEDVSLAQFVFSDNWEHDDTKGLGNSDAYLKQLLAIFSSQYVIDAVHNGFDKVHLGTYFLVPPAIKDSISLRTINKTVRHEGNIVNPPSKNSMPEPSSMMKECHSSSSCSSISEKSQLLIDPGKHSQKTVSTNQLKAQKEASTTSLTTSTQHINTFLGTERIDLDSIPHIKDLPKVISCLRTLHPGKDGVEVKYVT